MSNDYIFGVTIYKGGLFLLEIFDCTYTSLEEFCLARDTIRENLQKICPKHSIQLFVAVNEAVNNAFLHGINDNKGTQVTINMLKDNDELRIAVSHNGEGFIPQYTDCSTLDQVYSESGRGIDIIKHYVDSLEYSVCGREVIMRKKLN
ncbi:MAG: ATP-binding protein [Pelosinus sp.]|nr:ATP-binding protein [Pelosinus sp.]